MNHNYVHIVVECPPVYYCSVRCCRACLNHLGQMPVGFWAVLGRWAGSVLRRSGAGGLRAGEVFVASKNMLYSREAPSLCSTMYRCCLLQRDATETRRSPLSTAATRQRALALGARRAIVARPPSSAMQCPKCQRACTLSPSYRWHRAKTSAHLVYICSMYMYVQALACAQARRGGRRNSAALIACATHAALLQPRCATDIYERSLSLSAKGQIISKANYIVLNSSKKRT